MKKIFLILSVFCVLLGVTACQSKKPKELKQGDEVIKDGVIYTYYTYEELYESAIPFAEEDTPKPYYNYYYYDMSSYKEQPAIVPFKGVIVENYNPPRIDGILRYPREYYPDVFHNFLIYSDVHYSPKTAYFYRLIDYFSPTYVGEGFIVTGYTKDLKKDVEIPSMIENVNVNQIGFKAFENAPMETLTFLPEYYQSNWGGIVYDIIHPFAFSNCENLKTIKTAARVLSMGISNCPNLEEIYYISPTTDCTLYNLPKLKKIIECHPEMILSNHLFYDEKETFHEFDKVNLYNTGGIRKSAFFLCPNLKEITGNKLSRRNNVVFIYSTLPYYAFDDYTIMLQDWFFSGFEYDNPIVASYNEENELYLPYLNNGLNYKGELFIDPESKNIKEEANAFYVTTSYPKIVEDAVFYEEEYEDQVVLKILKKGF